MGEKKEKQKDYKSSNAKVSVMGEICAIAEEAKEKKKRDVIIRSARQRPI